MKKALVTAIGSFASDIVIKTLKEEGMYVVGCDVYPQEWLAQSLETDEFHQVPFAAEKEKYVNFLKELCEKGGIDFLIPLTDVEVDVLNCRREEFFPTLLCISKEETITLCRDKWKLEKFIREKNLCPTIPSLKLGELENPLQEIPWEKSVLKPFNGRSSSGLYRVCEKEKLPFYIGLAGCKEEYLIQPMIEGEVITVDVVRDGKGNAGAVPRKEHLRTGNGAGTSVEVFRDKELEETCINLAEALDVKGCVNFEFIEERETGKRYFMECNPRFSGGAAFSCRAGCNVVKKHIQVFRDGKMEGENGAVHAYIARKYEEYMMPGDK